MSKVNVFEVVRLDVPMPWTVKHKPTGLYAGSFHYRAHALAAAAAMKDLTVEHPELTEAHDHYSRAAMNALFDVRKAHTDADRVQAVAAEAKRKRKNVLP